jgi:hypothetical protein
MIRTATRAALLCLLLAAPVSFFGQNSRPPEEAGHIFTVTMLKIPLNQVNDFLDFWEKTFVPLEKQDPSLLSSEILRHRWGTTDYSVFLIQEFKDLASVQESRTREEGSLQQRAQTDPAVAEAMKSFGSYVAGHVDYILFAPEQVRKHEGK